MRFFIKSRHSTCAETFRDSDFVIVSSFGFRHSSCLSCFSAHAHLSRCTARRLKTARVVIDSNRIQAVGAFSDIAPHFITGKTIDLGERALLPGLINAHCHLDYTMMRHAIGRQKILPNGSCASTR